MLGHAISVQVLLRVALSVGGVMENGGLDIFPPRIISWGCAITYDVARIMIFCAILSLKAIQWNLRCQCVKG